MIVVPIAFFLLRQCGQGLMVLTASTIINRYIEEGRGRATAFSKIGSYIHMAIMPALALFLIHYMSWQQVWLAYGVFILAFLIPFFLFMFRDHVKRRKKHVAILKALKKKAKTEGEKIRADKTQIDVLHDPSFHILWMILLIAPCFTTAIFFFQSTIAEAHGVSHGVFVSTFIVLTICAVCGNLISGYVMDHIGEVFMMCLVPFVYALGLIGLILSGNLLSLTISMGLVGFSDGASGTLGAPIMAELFGTKYLGAVKSLLFSIMVVGTAISPVFGGVLLDNGYDIFFILKCFLSYTVVVWAVLMFSLKLFK